MRILGKPALRRAGRRTVIVVVQHFVFVRPADNRETVVVVVPLLIAAHGDHRHFVLSRAGGDEVVCGIAGRLAGCVRERNEFEDALRDGTQARSGDERKDHQG